MSTESGREGTQEPQESTSDPEGIPGLIQPESGPERPTSSREHAVPCKKCGFRFRYGAPVPNTMTYNDSALCDHHERNDS